MLLHRERQRVLERLAQVCTFTLNRLADRQTALPHVQDIVTVIVCTVAGDRFFTDSVLDLRPVFVVLRHVLERVRPLAVSVCLDFLAVYDLVPLLQVHSDALRTHLVRIVVVQPRLLTADRQRGICVRERNRRVRRDRPAHGQIRPVLTGLAARRRNVPDNAGLRYRERRPRTHDVRNPDVFAVLQRERYREAVLFRPA